MSDKHYRAAVEALADIAPSTTRTQRAQHALQLDEDETQEHLVRIAMAVDHSGIGTSFEKVMLAHIMGLELGERLGYARAMEDWASFLP